MHTYSLSSSVITKVVSVSAISATILSGLTRNTDWFEHLESLFVPTPLVLFGIIFFLLDKFSLNYKITQKLLGIPNLSGKWEGELKRTDKSGTETKRTVNMQIDQTLTKISIKFQGESSQSRSYSALLNNSNPNDIRLHWIYNSEDNSANPNKNLYGHGTTMLDMKQKEMSGTYYSTKLSKGQIVLTLDEQVVNK